MSKIIRKRKRLEKCLEREELELLEKSVLIDKILRLQANNEQLRAVIKKTNSQKVGKKENTRKTQKPFDFTKWSNNIIKKFILVALSGNSYTDFNSKYFISRCYRRHILLKFYYLGWEYNGFVVQEDTSNTIEHHLFEALIKSCCIESRETSNYHRCGRTDKGVSSFSQVISLDIRSKLKPEDQSKVQDELPYCKILNRLLPSNIRCIAWCPASSNFSARFDCKFRTYKYFFPRGNLDINAMDKAIKYSIGDHDFRNVCKMDVGNGVIEFKRTILDAKVSVYKDNLKNRSGYEMCEIVITSQAFLWHQIRCLVGILLLVGQGKESPEVLLNILDIEKCPRKPQYNMAHEIPLNLWYCEYEDKEWFTDEYELINTIKILQRDWTFNTIKSTMIESMLSNLENTINRSDLSFQSDCLLFGVQSKVYQPLMERITCESLENKIKHYKKKGKLEIIQSNIIQSE